MKRRRHDRHLTSIDVTANEVVAGVATQAELNEVAETVAAEAARDMKADLDRACLRFEQHMTRLARAGIDTMPSRRAMTDGLRSYAAEIDGVLDLVIAVERSAPEPPQAT